MPFICRYRGGIYPTGKLPPCVCFVLFSYFAFPHDHQRPSQTTETVHNCFSGPSLDRRNVLCGERAVLHRFLRFSRALSLESSLSAHSCRLIKRKSTTSCHGRPFDHPFHSRVTEPRNFSPSAARLHPSYSFVALDGLSGLTTTRSGEPYQHIGTRERSRPHSPDSEIGGLGPNSRVCRGRKC